MRALWVAAEGAGKVTSGLSDLPKAAHRLSHERNRRNSEVRSQRAVGPHNSPRAVVHHDVIADRVNVFYPLLLRPLQLRKSLEVFERERRMTRQRPQQPLFLWRKSLLFTEQTQRSELFFVARRDSNENGNLRLFCALQTRGDFLGQSV